MDVRPYLKLERALTSRLVRAWGPVASEVFSKVHDAVRERDFSQAQDMATRFNLRPIADRNQEWIKYHLLQAGVFGGKIAQDGGATLIESLNHDKLLSRVAHVITVSIDRDMTTEVYKNLLALIQKAERGELVTKGAPKLKDDSEDDAPDKDPNPKRFVKEFVSFKDKGDKQLQLVSSLHTSRLSAWGFFQEANAFGLERYRLTAVLDGRTSDWCRMIDGYEFDVDRGDAHINEALSAEDPEQLKEVQPWPKQDKKSMAKWEALSEEELQDLGYDVPPFHPNCRTLCVRIDQDIEGEPDFTDVTTYVPPPPQDAATLQKPDATLRPPDAQVRPVAVSPPETPTVEPLRASPDNAPPAPAPTPHTHEPTEEQAAKKEEVKTSLQDIGSTVLTAALLTWWLDEEPEVKPEEVLSTVTGIPVEELKKDDSPLADQQFFAKGPDETLKISVEQQTDEVESDLRLTYDPYQRILYTGAMDVKAEEAAAAVWMANTYRRNVEVAKQLGAKQLWVQTDGETSAYAHAQMGFVPTVSDWFTLRDEITAEVDHGVVGADERDALRQILSSGDPRAIWELANLPSGERLLAHRHLEMLYAWDDPMAAQKFGYVVGT